MSDSKENNSSSSSSSSATNAAAITMNAAATSTTPTTTTTNTTANATNTETQAEPPQVTRQRYEEAKHELQALLARKKQVDTNLINLEHAIYLFEGSYLEDTQQNGNIIRGFDGYLTNRPDRRRPKFTELDRLFSLSSSTYQKALALKEEKDQESSQESVSGSFSARREKKRKLKNHDGKFNDSQIQ